MYTDYFDAQDFHSMLLRFNPLDPDMVVAHCRHHSCNFTSAIHHKDEHAQAEYDAHHKGENA